jgi:hypothetical protein
VPCHLGVLWAATHLLRPCGHRNCSERGHSCLTFLSASADEATRTDQNARPEGPRSGTMNCTRCGERFPHRFRAGLVHTFESVHMQTVLPLHAALWRTCRGIANRTRLQIFGLLIWKAMGAPLNIRNSTRTSFVNDWECCATSGVLSSRKNGRGNPKSRYPISERRPKTEDVSGTQRPGAFGFESPPSTLAPCKGVIRHPRGRKVIVTAPASRP